MDQNKNTSNEPGRTPGGSGISGTTGATGSTGGRTGGGSPSSGSPGSGGSPTGQSSGGYPSQTTGSAPQRAKEQNTGGGQSTYDQTLQSVTDAYGKTTEVLTKSYDEAMSYGRENPGKLTLIAFGAGIAIGLLLSNSGGRSRTNRIAEPVVNALSQVAMEFFR